MVYTIELEGEPPTSVEYRVTLPTKGGDPPPEPRVVEGTATSFVTEKDGQGQATKRRYQAGQSGLGAADPDGDVTVEFVVTRTLPGGGDSETTYSGTFEWKDLAFGEDGVEAVGVADDGDPLPPVPPNPVSRYGVVLNVKQATRVKLTFTFTDGNELHDIPGQFGPNTDTVRVDWGLHRMGGSEGGGGGGEPPPPEPPPPPPPGGDPPGGGGSDGLSGTEEGPSEGVVVTTGTVEPGLCYVTATANQPADPTQLPATLPLGAEATEGCSVLSKANPAVLTSLGVAAEVIIGLPQPRTADVTLSVTTGCTPTGPKWLWREPGSGACGCSDLSLPTGAGTHSVDLDILQFPLAGEHVFGVIAKDDGAKDRNGTLRWAAPVSDQLPVHGSAHFVGDATGVIIGLQVVATEGYTRVGAIRIPGANGQPDTHTFLSAKYEEGKRGGVIPYGVPGARDNCLKSIQEDDVFYYGGHNAWTPVYDGNGLLLGMESRLHFADGFVSVSDIMGLPVQTHTLKLAYLDCCLGVTDQIPQGPSEGPWVPAYPKDLSRALVCARADAVVGYTSFLFPGGATYVCDPFWEHACDDGMTVEDSVKATLKYLDDTYGSGWLYAQGLTAPDGTPYLVAHGDTGIRLGTPLGGE